MKHDRFAAGAGTREGRRGVHDATNVQNAHVRVRMQPSQVSYIEDQKECDSHDRDRLDYFCIFRKMQK
jgi:hypothetical protein